MVMSYMRIVKAHTAKLAAFTYAIWQTTFLFSDKLNAYKK